MFEDETEDEFYTRVLRLRAVKWLYLSDGERQTILDYLASYRRTGQVDPDLKDKLRPLLRRAGL